MRKAPITEASPRREAPCLGVTKAFQRVWRRLRGVLPWPSRRVSDEPPVEDPDRTDDRAQLGLWGERVAADFLKAKRYRIVGCRVRVGRDELDLIAVPLEDRVPQLVFVEVKTRRSPDFGGPIAALNRRKRHALCRAAARYLRRLPPPGSPFRFDAVEVIGAPKCGTPVIRHTENAFPMEARYVTPWLSGRHRRT